MYVLNWTIQNNAIVGRTVPSYRIATEVESSKWKIFRQRLDKKDRKIFDKMFSYSRLYNSGAAMLADLYWFIRFLCLLYLNITSNSIKYRMKVSKLIVLYNRALPKSCIFAMNFLWQPGQIKNDVPYGSEEWSSKLTTDNMMGFGLSQYMHRKTSI